MSNRVKLSELSPGDHVIADATVPCVGEGTHTVFEVECDGEPGLAIRCSGGWHFLDGQLGAGGYLVGFTRPSGSAGHA